MVQGGMTAVLSFLDFFPPVVQRTAVSTAATMATRTSMETLACALEALPQLLPLLDYQDHAIADSACLALNRITTAAAACVPSDLLLSLFCSTWHSAAFRST
jgi:hypothetical protein